MVEEEKDHIVILKNTYESRKLFFIFKNDCRLIIFLQIKVEYYSLDIHPPTTPTKSPNHFSLNERNVKRTGKGYQLWVQQIPDRIPERTFYKVHVISSYKTKITHSQDIYRQSRYTEIDRRSISS